MLPRIDGSYLAAVMLLEDHLIFAENDTLVTHFTSQQACVHALMTKTIDICGIAYPVKQIFEHKLNIKFKVLATTSALPNVTYAIHPRLGSERIEDMRKYLTSREGFVPANITEYDAYQMRSFPDINKETQKP